MNTVTELIKLTLDQLDVPIFILSPSGECKYLNTSAKQLLAIEDLNSCSEFWPDFENNIVLQDQLITTFLGLDGKRFKVLLRVSYLDERSYLVVVLSKALDGENFTDLHNQRIETLGILAGGIAHDFNNILAGILGHVTYLKTVLPDEGKHVESLKSIEEGGRKAARLTREILNFSRLETADKAVPIDPRDVVERSCTLLRGAFPPNVAISVSAIDRPFRILGDEAKLSQVIVNLLMNAKDALNNQGEINVEIEVKAVCEEVNLAFKAGDLSASEYVVISVKDTGSGIPPEQLEKIFDAYFSTKGERGTGIGLATVKSIVTEFGGAITVVSKVNIGTEFRVYLPNILDSQSVKESVPSDLKTSVGAGERILVVDDEAPVRNIVLRSLEHLGYEVTSSESGNEALSLYSAESAYDLVILDMLMPNLSGEEVFDRLKLIDPKVNVLVISGFSSPAAVQKILDGGGKGFLQKPFTIEQLSNAVSEALIENR